MLNQISMIEMIIPLNQIKPGRYQHRRLFKPGPLLELAESIQQSGLINPPVVYRDPSTGSGSNGHYELLIGERRWRAVSALALAQAGLIPLAPAVEAVCDTVPDSQIWPVLANTTLPVRVCGSTDPATLQTLALIENLQREDLTPLEEAHDFASLAALGHSPNRIARLTGKNWSYVKGMLDWLELEPQIQELLESGELFKDHRVSGSLLSIPDPALRLKLARQFAARKSPIRAIVAVCERAKAWPPESTQLHVPAAIPAGGAVPVNQVKVEVATPAPEPVPQPCLCPACAIKIHELAEELCGGCRAHGLTLACLQCEGVIEVLNRLIAMSEAAYA